MSPFYSVVLSFLALTSHGASFQQGSKAQGLFDEILGYHHPPTHDTDYAIDPSSSTPATQVPDIKIDNYLVRSSLSDSMQQTLDLIKNVESLPSCAKIASSALLHSCSALEGSIKHDESELTRGSDLFVEEEADIYSARLAVCELSGADFSIPKECRSFIPDDKVKRKRGICGFWSRNGASEPTTTFQSYDEITLSNLQQCRRALGSTSQSWTSYSNNRQNAVVMCRAMRSEIEKDDQLHVGKILASAAAAATESLQDALEAINLLKTQFNELTTAMPQFQKDLVAGNEQQLDYVRQFWSQIEQVRGGLKDILQDFDGVRHGLRSSKDEVTDLGSAIRKAAMDSTASMQEVVIKTQHEMTSLSENAAALSEVGEYLLEMFKQGVIKALYNVTQDIGVINAFMPTLNRELTTWREANSQMHQESLARHAENQAHLNQTAATLEQFHQAAYKMNATMASISSFVGIGWPGALELLKTTAAFVCYTLVYALLSFGLWEKYAGLYFLGTVLASTATGLGKLSPTLSSTNFLTLLTSPQLSASSPLSISAPSTYVASPASTYRTSSSTASYS